jgi:hypothetical protein
MSEAHVVSVAPHPPAGRGRRKPSVYRMNSIPRGHASARPATRAKADLDASATRRFATREI